MNAGGDALARLAQMVADRRRELRLTKEAAARKAVISPISWKRVEDGRSVRELTYAAVESVLGWAPGSCTTVLDGGEPGPRGSGQDVPPAVHVPDRFMDDPILKQIRAGRLRPERQALAIRMRVRQLEDLERELEEIERERVAHTKDMEDMLAVLEERDHESNS